MIKELLIAAESRTHPAAVIQLRPGWGERKKTSDGWLVWLSSTSANHRSHGGNSSSVRPRSQPMRA